MKSYIGAILATISVAEVMFEPTEVIPSIFTEDEGLEMLLRTYQKYNANIDFEGGF